MDDWLFWHEWIITALVVMTVFFGKQIADKTATVGTFAGYVLLMALGLLLVPVGIGGWLCNGSGEIKGHPQAAIANVLGLLFLVAVVALGGKIYG